MTRWMLLVAVVAAAGCANEAQTLEDEVRSALDGHGGAESFLLPDSDDFAAIPQDTKNVITAEKVALGRLLFHDPLLNAAPQDEAGMQTSSCAACHHASAGFQAGARQGLGEGGEGFGERGEARHVRSDYELAKVDAQPIRSPTSMNGAWQPNQLWNGQFGATELNVGTEAKWTENTPKAKNHLGYEGLETQAIAGQDVHRLSCDKSRLADNSTYKAMFDAAFADVPEAERVSQVNAGLAIAAYERTVLANRAPFQRFLRGEAHMLGDDALRGAALFFGKANCVACHTGPALNTMAFHAIGMGDLEGTGVTGYDPTKPEHLGRGGFTGRPEDNFKFKVPQLYNLTDSPFLGHGGTFTSVRAVVEYKSNARVQRLDVPAGQLAAEFVPRGLSSDEIDDLVAFLERGLLDPELGRYEPSVDELPSGMCVIVDDDVSRRDLGCQ